MDHNNLAYHAHLAGDLVAAREHIEAGLALAEDGLVGTERKGLQTWAERVRAELGDIML